MIGTEGARLLREKRVQGRPHRRKGAEEAPGPPAESECNVRIFKTLKKTVDKLDFHRVCLQSETFYEGFFVLYSFK
ncbi:hypothetical protein AKG34_12540 [Peribacillus butanolivorans]|nr:hypothetical protein AKG34_12540 [Peribacillus butanolivorans]